MASVVLIGGFVKWIKHKIWGKQHQLEKNNETFLGWLDSEINQTSQDVFKAENKEELTAIEQAILEHDKVKSADLLNVKSIFIAIQEYGADFENVLRDVSEAYLQEEEINTEAIQEYYARMEKCVYCQNPVELCECPEIFHVDALEFSEDKTDFEDEWETIEKNELAEEEAQGDL
jgi:hypothetical protein